MGNNGKQKSIVTYPVAVIIAAVITAVGVVSKPIVEKWMQRVPSVETGNTNFDLISISVDEIDWSPKEKIQGLKANEIYQAKSSGFVTAFSHGDNPPAGVIYSGSDLSSERDLLRRTRFQEWDGASLWIRKGEYWLVKTEIGRESGIIVQWIPFR